MKAYTLRNIERTPDTMKVFIRIMEQFIHEANVRSGGDTQMFSCIIDSMHFKKHKHMQIPYRRYDQNTAEAIWNMLELVQQSHPHVDLVTHPMSVMIVTVPSQGVVRTAGSRPQQPEVEHCISRNALIPVGNTRDSLCLFYAVALTHYYLRMEKTPANCRHFLRLTTHQTDYAQRQRRQLVDELLEGIEAEGFGRVPRNCADYSVEEYAPLLQRYFDATEPQEFRLSVFNHRGSYRPIWKGESVARNELAIVHLGNHFNGIKNLNSFFGKKKYCIDCERPYSENYKHTVMCKSKCVNCCGKGFGTCNCLVA
jgi:hypothetical protein